MSCQVRTLSGLLRVGRHLGGPPGLAGHSMQIRAVRLAVALLPRWPLPRVRCGPRVSSLSPAWGSPCPRGRVATPCVNCIKTSCFCECLGATPACFPATCRVWKRRLHVSPRHGIFPSTPGPMSFPDISMSHPDIDRVKVLRQCNKVLRKHYGFPCLPLASAHMGRYYHRDSIQRARESNPCSRRYIFRLGLTPRAPGARSRTVGPVKYFVGVEVEVYRRIYVACRTGTCDMGFGMR